MTESHNGETIIGPDATIKGEMSIENRARILGRFEGTIRSKGQVEVADKATCKAVVEAGTVQVDGTVEGNITATERVQLNATARVTGDLVAAKLVVTEGASFTGHVTVGPNALKGRTAGPAAAEAPRPSRPSTMTAEPGAPEEHPAPAKK
jgi:cytoskeletal protein CcmA (bactofilin family)